MLFQFNNCGKNNSQMAGLSSSSSAVNILNTPNNLADTPVSNRNPYVLQCINSSDGVKVSSKLNLAVKPQKFSASGKLIPQDWAQDEDLIISLDNTCIAAGNYTDSMMNYLTAGQIQLTQPLTVYTLKKLAVDNLKLFIERANDSECLIAAEKNQQIKIKADVADPLLGYSIQLSSIGATDSFLTSLMNYNGSSLYKTKVALVDTGVDYTNPDLAGSMAVDSSGQIIGYNSTDSSTSFTDSGFHGTHVAGLVAAGFHNGVLSSGVWGRNIAIYPVRGSNDGENFKVSDVANGIIWATDKGVDIINLSLGTTTESIAIKSAISYAMSKNVLVVVAAGNDGALLSTTNPMYPAMYSTQFSGLITVASTDIQSTTLSSFSNYSSTYVDILAPGSYGTNGIYSTLPMNKVSNLSTGFGSKIKMTDGKFSTIHGTSMATPLVTGSLAAAISLAKAKAFTLTNSELKTFLKNEGSYKISTYGSFAADGRLLNFQGLIAAIKNKIDSTVVTPIAPTTDSLSISLQPISKRAVEAEKVELKVTAISNLTPTYQWYFNGAKISGATTASYTVNSVLQSNAGVYHVAITAGSLNVVSSDVEIKVALRYCTAN